MSDLNKLVSIYNKYRNKEKLTKEELRYIYEIDDFISGEKHVIYPMINEIKSSRNQEEDYAVLFGCDKERLILTESDIGIKSYDIMYINTSDFLLDRKFICNFNDPTRIVVPFDAINVYINNIKHAHGLHLSPKKMINVLELNGLTSVDGLDIQNEIFELYLNGIIGNENMEISLSNIIQRIELSNLVTAKNITLSGSENVEINLGKLEIVESLELNFEKISTLNLNSLRRVNKLKLPDTVDRLILNSLTDTKNLTLPKNVCILELNGLTSIEGLNIPEGVYSLSLNGLTSVEGLKIPESVTNLSLDGLTSAEGLNIPEGVYSLSLNGLTSTEGLNISKGVERLSLNGIKDPKKFNLSKSVSSLELNGLTSTEGLNIPKGVYSLSLNGIKDPQKFNLSKCVSSLSLNGLTSAEGLNIPEGLYLLSLDGLTSLKGLKLPKGISCISLKGLTNFENIELLEGIEVEYDRSAYKKYCDLKESKKTMKPKKREDYNKDELIFKGKDSEYKNIVLVGIDSCIVSDVGNKANNEDSAIAMKHPKVPEFKLIAVADGLGGYEVGEVASSIAIEKLRDWFVTFEINDELYADSECYKIVSESLKMCIKDLNDTILNETGGKISATTLAVAVICGDYTILLNIGDSRIYSYNQGEIQLLTEDQTEVWDGRENVDITRFHNHSNIMTNCILSSDSNREKDVYTYIPTNQLKYIILCTDGVSDMMSYNTMKNIMQHNGDNIELAATSLVKYATISYEYLDKSIVNSSTEFISSLDAGKDNATISIMRVRAKY